MKHKTRPAKKTSPPASRIVTVAVVSLILLSSVAVAWKIRAHKAAPPPVNAVIGVNNPYPNYYVKRNYNPDPNPSPLAVPQQWNEILTDVDDDTLVGIRCSEQIQDDYGLYYLREPNDHSGTKQITNPTLIALLDKANATIQQPRKLLTARFCETNTDKILFEYTEGVQVTPHPDLARDVRAYVALVDNPDAFTTGQVIFTQPQWPYPGCHQAYMLTKENKIYYSCGVLNEKGSQTYYFAIDLMAKTTQKMFTCTTDYTGNVSVTCE